MSAGAASPNWRAVGVFFVGQAGRELMTFAGVVLIDDAERGGSGMCTWPQFRPISADVGSTRSRGDKRSTARRHAGAKIAECFGRSCGR